MFLLQYGAHSPASQRKARCRIGYPEPDPARSGRPRRGGLLNKEIEVIMLHKAAKLAEQAHRGQTDKTGRPYIEHVRRVADAVETLDEKTVAYLHDVVEKGEGWTLDRLEAAGFGFPVVAAVDALTRRLDEGERRFISRAAANPLARPVKVADLKDNLWQAHQAGIEPGRYETGLRLLDELTNH